MSRIGMLAGLAALLLSSWGCKLEHPEIDREQAIRDAWENQRPSHTGSPYSTDPILTGPGYATGVLASGFLNDAVNMVRFVRFLAGVADDMSLDAPLTAAAQAGAMLMAVNNSVDPGQAAPADMDLTLASLALINVRYALLDSGSASLAEAVRDNWVRGSADLATAQAASRRWLLNPALYKIGFGFAESATSSYASLEVRDTSRPSVPSWSYIAWPGGDFFPVEFFNAGDPWTITLNPAEYYVPAADQIVVTLSRYFVGPTWNLTSEDEDQAGEYLTVSTDPYGVANCIIFRPGPTVAYSAGDRFSVQVTGLHPIEDAPEELSFNVMFISLD